MYHSSYKLNNIPFSRFSQSLAATSPHTFDRVVFRGMECCAYVQSFYSS